jgi:4-hydroxy-tetrahydrodipicolinate synthase
MLALNHPIAAETRMPITCASAQLVERLRKAHEECQSICRNAQSTQ